MKAKSDAKCLCLVVLGLICLAAPAKAYELGPEDVLMIEVWPDARMTREVVVADDGTIPLPGVGRVQAAGLTERELEDEIRHRLEGEFLAQAQVTIIIKEYRSRAAKVIGEARKTGRIKLPKDCTLVDLLVEVDGTTPQSDNRVVILRKPKAEAAASGTAQQAKPAAPDKTPKETPPKAGADQVGRHGAGVKLELGELSGALVINYRRIVVDLTKVRNGEREASIRILPGDVVMFPGKANMSVYVMGEVRGAGMFPVAAGTTLLEAISMAGGVLPTAGSVIKVIKPPMNLGESGESLEQFIEKAQESSLTGESSDSVIEDYDIDDVLAGGKGADRVLEHREIVLVPRSDSDQFFIMGAVRAPGSYPVRDNLTVIKAISMAGGLTPLGDKDRLKIHRDTPTGTKEIDAKFTDLVIPGDTVEVKERLW